MSIIALYLYHFYSRIIKQIRNNYWKLLVKKMGMDVKIHGKITIFNPDNVEIGDRCAFNESIILNAREKIIIGNDVIISSGVTINTGGLQYPSKRHFSKKVMIEDNVWIGSNATINPGVTIGHNSVIGAGSVVTKNIEPYSVAVGVPARKIKTVEIFITDN